MDGQRSTADSSSSSQSPSSHPDSTSPPSLSDDLTLYPQSFPFSPVGPAVVAREMIENNLPQWERANFLAETFFDQISWLFRGMTRTQVMGEMLPIIYKRHLPSSYELEDDYSGPHDLALLFMVFAIGALVETHLDPLSSEAEDFHQFARLALCRQSVLEKPTLVTIQTLRLLAIYNGISNSEYGDDETSLETTWSLTTLAIHLSQTVRIYLFIFAMLSSDISQLSRLAFVCLWPFPTVVYNCSNNVSPDRDGARWGLSPKMVERRRILFWDLYVTDAWEVNGFLGIHLD